MQNPRKSKAPADIPAPTPTSPAVFVKEGDPGALAALSAGIALSIGSPSNDLRGMSSDGTTGMDVGLKTTYSAVRMVVEITKESSDLCPPLKTVMGAVFALMKHFDVSVSCSRTEHMFTFFPFHALANSRQYRKHEGDQAEGRVTVWCACLTCERR